jgi:hypothetical protein
MSERMIGPERPAGAPRGGAGLSLRDLPVGRVNGLVPALLTVTMVVASPPASASARARRWRSPAPSARGRRGRS